jgi:NAD(P)-dependent dehydrogenase (short-subunit alcohol dehydrogenase family)
MGQIKWDTENIPEQNGHVVIVTGSTSGIGYEAARVLALKNADVILAVRNIAKGESAVAKIKGQQKGAKVRVMELDLASLKSVRAFSEKFKSTFGRLDLLINNAGVMIPPYGKTADGFELQFGTNYLGHFALTGLLLDYLLKTDGARIVNVSSSAHRMGNIDLSDLQWEKRKYKAWRAYGDSKIANLYFTYELQKRLRNRNLTLRVTAAHPGWTATELQRHSGFTAFLNHFFAQDITMGALPTLRAATDVTVTGGEFFGPSGWMELHGYPVKTDSNKLSHDEAIGLKLWKVAEKLTGVKFSV